MGWLIAYDISCPRRWRRIYRELRSVGYRLQYSLFWADIDGPAAEALARRLMTLMDLRADDIRLYHLPDAAPVRFRGPKPWPDGIDHAAARRFGGCFVDPAAEAAEYRHGLRPRSLK